MQSIVNLVASCIEVNMIKVEFKNWEKYNPKRAQSTYTWLRLNNDIATEPDLFGLKSGQKWAYVCLLCRLSKKNLGRIELDLDWFSDITGESISSITNMLEKLQKRNVLHWTTLDYTVLPPSTTPTNETDGRTNETNETNTSKPHPREFDFSSIYDAYPRKIGKKSGLERLRKSVKTAEAYADLQRAVENYSRHVATTESKFIKHFSTWANSWQDWVDCDAPDQNSAGMLPGNAALIRDILAEND